MSSVNNQVRPSIQDYQPVRPTNIVVPTTSTEIKVKTRTSERMEELKKAVEKKGDQVLGSKAQTALIKARIEAISVPHVRDQAQAVPLSKMETAKKYGLIALRVLGGLATAGISELVINRHDIKDSIGNKYHNFSNNIDYSVGERYVDAGNRALQKSGRLDQMIGRMTDQARLEVEVGSTRRRIGLLENTTPMTGEIRTQIESLKGTLRSSEGQLEAINRGLAENRAEFGDGNMPALRKKMLEIRQQGNEAIQIGTDIKGGKLEMAEKYGAKNLLKIASLGHGVFSIVNSVALAKTVAESGTNLLSITETTREAAAASIGVSRNAVGIAAVVAAPITILLEGRELYQTFKNHSQALSKVEMAEALLNTQDRSAMKADFEKQLKKAETGGWFSKPDPAKAEAMRAKIAALDALPAPDTLSPETRAMAAQIVKHADVGHKRHTMFKNVLAITASVLTIASFAMGPLAPAGLALAATVIGVGAAIYGISLLVKKFRTSSQRQSQINTLNNNHTQIQMKREALTTEKGTLSAKHAELTAKKQLHTDRIALINKFKQDAQVPSHEELAKFVNLQPPLTTDDFRERSRLNMHVSSSEDAIRHGLNPHLEEINQQVTAIDQNLTGLSELQKQNTIELLACSPHDAAQKIFEGATATPPEPSMAYLAGHVLRVDCHNLPPEVAKEQLARGMNLNPEQ